MNTATTTPRFRTDLVTQPIDAEGQRFVDVTDPDSGTTFRFYEVEYAIACAMDGRRDVRGLASWALEELGLETTPGELQTVISTLGELGYLEEAPAIGGDVELGTPGGAPPAPTGAHIESGDFELGQPGKSPIARERPAAPAAESIDLGAPGAGASQPPAQAMGSGGDEQSFEGLLDDEPPTKVRQAPARSLQIADDAQTAVRREAAPAQPTSDFMDGITPPPAEVPSPKLRPVTEPASDDDGPTNLPPPAPGLEDEPEVSVDLSEHLSIDAGDVKEAVRQSQVMQAVDVPDDLLAELEKESASEPPPSATKPVELPAEPAKITSAKPKGAVEPPEEKAPEPEPKRAGVSGFLVFLLFVVLAGAGAYWYFMIYKKGQEEKATTAPPTVQGPTAVTPPTPPAPPPVTAVLTVKEAEAAVVAMPSSGGVTINVEDGAEVAAGDLIATLKGAERIQARIKKISDRRDQYQGWLDRDLGKIEGAEGAVKDKLQKNIDKFKDKVESKTKQVEELQVELDKLLLKAPAGGTVKVVGKSGYVKEGEPLVEIAGESLLAATFKLPAGKTLEVGGTATVATKDSPDATATCDVVAVEGGSATVLCADAAPLADGATIILK